MTMPEKIYAYTYDIQLDDDSWDTDIPAWAVDNPKLVSAVTYIRADLAEEMARALKEIREETGNLPNGAKLALARYHAAIAP